ncbi:hypothetical protein [Enterovibrio paralichthyis]|uniref:hypothetical protein n=1 Tax=Enterovibrio paralichthyis TaxID=2853805 RepID=UPI001C496915|nr:hypothetical protein [Enterovibrio paralichthyis]MBV7300750.1 hypothetical protein [Enterovibrio paralichthyis]
MKKSHLFRCITFPDLVAGLPKKYAAIMLVASLGGGWVVAIPVMAVFSKPNIGWLLIIAPLIAVVMWAFGFIKTSNDPEWFDVWVRRTFGIGQSVVTGDRHYEP